MLTRRRKLNSRASKYVRSVIKSSKSVKTSKGRLIIYLTTPICFFYHKCGYGEYKFFNKPQKKSQFIVFEYAGIKY